MTKAAVFDLDGVLLDSMGIWNDLGARYLRSLGVTPEEGLNEILFSMSMEQGAEYLHTHYALPQSAAEVGAGIADMLRDFYFYEVPAKDGAAALLGLYFHRAWSAGMSFTRLLGYAVLCQVLTVAAGLLFVALLLGIFWLAHKLGHIEGERWEQYLSLIHI